MLMALLGTMAIFHVKPATRDSWRPNYQLEWCIGRTKEHCMCYTILCQKYATLSQHTQLGSLRQKN